MEEELNQTNLELQTSMEQVGDLSVKVTVLTTGKKQHYWTQIVFALWNHSVLSHTFWDLKQAL